jgi:hypothetical protein
VPWGTGNGRSGIPVKLPASTFTRTAGAVRSRRAAFKGDAGVAGRRHPGTRSGSSRSTISPWISTRQEALNAAVKTTW